MSWWRCTTWPASSSRVPLVYRDQQRYAVKTPFIQKRRRRWNIPLWLILDSSGRTTTPSPLATSWRCPRTRNRAAHNVADRQRPGHCAISVYGRQTRLVRPRELYAVAPASKRHVVRLHVWQAADEERRTRLFRRFQRDSGRRSAAEIDITS